MGAAGQGRLRGWSRGGGSGRVEELGHEGPEPLAAVAEAGDREPVDVFVDLPFAEEEELLEPFVEFVDATTEEDAECFEDGREGDIAGTAAGGIALGFVEVVMDFFAAFGFGIEDVFEVHDAEGEVARFVLGAHAEDALVGLGLADEFAHAEHRLDEAFGLDVHEDGHFGEVACFDEGAEAEAGALGEEAAAIGEGAFAEDVGVAGFVHDLGHEEEAGFEVLGGDEGHPLAGDVTGDEFDFGEHGGELAHCSFKLIGEGFEGVPGDVAGGAPLPLGGFFVEHEAVFRPDVGFGLVVGAEALGAGARDGAAHSVGHVAGSPLGIGVAAEVDLFEGEAFLSGLCGGGVFVQVEPRKVEAGLGAGVGCHGALLGPASIRAIAYILARRLERPGLPVGNFGRGEASKLGPTVCVVTSYLPGWRGRYLG